MPRPRAFNEDQILQLVSDAFWSKGYEATSTRDLVRVTGLTQPSLYNAFGDKRALFRRALEHYLDRSLRERIQRMEQQQPAEQAITAFFAETIQRSLADPLHRGCLLVNSALEASSDDPDLRQAINAELAQMQAFFERTIERIRDGIPALHRLTAHQAATTLLAVVLGIRVLARVNPSRELLLDSIQPVLSLLGLPALTLPSGETEHV
ncbi:TetR/AcrR family transcriptional regulator [Pokkaliibacter sp. MBI-7]|uniref:TetR/AcrR family transcriptional regulator n=1 Tax=Pokkaliibacter sp. MBI-7 TaxID=3040600 RepID=UPI002448534F|nr:TetR/AcrR family transcriptional regulator [Pokkaliibacter sp. MBI-7]MDH2434086.1 TetR/AcrR family transcriptional regulator [Pokkaliibacter sp. MBI-7]